MKDTIKAELRNRRPQHAEGRICIDLTDPETGKVKERVEGENHVFMDTIFNQMWYASNYAQYFSPWTATISGTHLLLTDSTAAINDKVPYIFGIPTGTGIPSQAGSGTFQGAYNSANQRRAAYNGESVYWKFQYDYTTAQANGSIGTVGLTYQNDGNYMYCLPDHVPSAPAGTYVLDRTADGRFAYEVSTAGVIAKYDLLIGTKSTIDKASVVGSNGSDYKKVGFDPSTGYYYIFVYSSTTANRKMYRFSDNAFVTLLATYSISNATYNYMYYDHPVYVYGNNLFLFYGEYVYFCDYANNTAITEQRIPRSALYPTRELRAQNYSLPFQSKYVHLGECDGYLGVIYDLQSKSVVSWINGTAAYSGAFQAMILHPNIGIPCTPGHLTPGYAYPTMYTKTAIAAKKLDTPVVKTTANGMTVTYELEVMY